MRRLTLNVNYSIEYPNKHYEYNSKKNSKGIFKQTSWRASAMGATTLRNKFQKARLKIEVVNCAIENIPAGVQILITLRKSYHVIEQMK